MNHNHKTSYSKSIIIGLFTVLFTISCGAPEIDNQTLEKEVQTHLNYSNQENYN